MGPSDQNDRQILAAYLRGDAGAFERLVDRHEGVLLRYVAHLLGDAEAAQDVVQEAFLRLIREARRLSHRDDLSPWLFRVSRNLAIDLIKKETRMRKRHEHAATSCADRAGAPAIENQEVLSIVARELDELPENQRDVLVLRIQQGKSYREISDITGLSSGNVGYLVHHGLRNLALRLKGAGAI